MSVVEVSGVCPPQLSPVKDAFAANLAEGLEQGARFTAVKDGEVIVDLWGGSMDRAQSRPWDESTLVPVFSTSKTVTALMMARLVDQGRITYDTRISDLWPEFGAAGKDQITLGDLLSHQAGLCGFSPSQPPEIWFDLKAVCTALAAQTPLWPPRSASGYHPVTGGVLLGEVFRRVDGRTLGTALQQDLCQPLGLEFFIGTPESVHDRCADLSKPTRAPDLGPINAIKMAAFLDKGSAPAGRGTTEWRKLELPSANGHGTSLALARLMGVMACGGKLDGVQVLSPDRVREAAASRITGPDLVLPFTLAWGAGFMRNEGVLVYGPGVNTVGHSGWGGSCAFADPDLGLSGAYVMNKQSHYLMGDPRSVRLIDALYAAL